MLVCCKEDIPPSNNNNNKVFSRILASLCQSDTNLAKFTIKTKANSAKVLVSIFSKV